MVCDQLDPKELWQLAAGKKNVYFILINVECSTFFFSGANQQDEGGIVRTTFLGQLENIQAFDRIMKESNQIVDKHNRAKLIEQGVYGAPKVSFESPIQYFDVLLS